MKKILIISLLFLIMYILGVLTVHYNFFPYNQKDLIKRKLKIKEYSQANISESKIRNNIIQKYYLEDPFLLSFKPEIKKYKSKQTFWSDRAYYNHKNDDKILKFHILSIPRHLKENISLNTFENIEIYRPTCVRNDNSIYNEWEVVDFELLIIGKSCIHRKVFKKKFKIGKIDLAPGGIISSDPILIKNLKDLDHIKIEYENR